MKTLDLFGAGGPKTLGLLVQSLSTYVQRYFGVAYEIVMAPKDFQLNTNYNGTKMCKFESNNYMLALYETPEYVSCLEVKRSNFIVSVRHQRPRRGLLLQLCRQRQAQSSISLRASVQVLQACRKCYWRISVRCFQLTRKLWIRKEISFFDHKEECVAPNKKIEKCFKNDEKKLSETLRDRHHHSSLNIFFFRWTRIKHSKRIYLFSCFFCWPGYTG